ncbi:hypothetical protein EDC04DRAFT_2972471 [Pisolithus marmoratus]|nr:hypothetical protein EDC04DRAFT_2972471 [Pisolithus marmoratus]
MAKCDTINADEKRPTCEAHPNVLLWMKTHYDDCLDSLWAATMAYIYVYLKDENGVVTGGMGRSVETNSWTEAVIEHDWSPNGKEFFSVITQLSIEQGICGGYSTSPTDALSQSYLNTISKAQVLSELEFMLSQKDGALQANTWDLTAQKHIEQLHNLVEASISQDELQQIFNQLRSLTRTTLQYFVITSPSNQYGNLVQCLAQGRSRLCRGTSSTNHLHEVKPPETSTIDYSRDASCLYRKAVLSEKVKLTMADILGLPMQCKQCGLRFRDDLCGKKQMDDHLDMHLRQNSGSTLSKKPVDVAQQDAELRAQFVVVLPGDKAKSIYCLICKETMKSKFLEDDKDWVWRDAVRKDDNISMATVLYKSQSSSPDSKCAMLKHKVDNDGFRLQYQNMGQLRRDVLCPHPLSFRMAKKCASGRTKPAQLAGHKRPQMSSTASFTPSSLSPLSSCPPSPDLQPMMIPNQSNRTVQGNTILASNEPTFINGVCERASKSQVCGGPILIIHFIYMGLNARGGVPCVLNTALEEYYSENNLCYLEVVFDFGTCHKLCLWRSKAESLAATIGEDIFQQKIFFISIHSEVTHSDLFAGKEGDGSDVAVRPEEFMNYLFSGGLQPLVSGATIFMLSCGPLIASSESICSLKKALLDGDSHLRLSNRLRPMYTVAFGAKHFISVVIKSFIITFGVRVVIQGHDLGEVFKDLLDVSCRAPHAY